VLRLAITGVPVAPAVSAVFLSSWPVEPAQPSRKNLIHGASSRKCGACIPLNGERAPPLSPAFVRVWHQRAPPCRRLDIQPSVEAFVAPLRKFLRGKPSVGGSRA